MSHLYPTVEYWDTINDEGVEIKVNALGNPVRPNTFRKINYKRMGTMQYDSVKKLRNLRQKLNKKRESDIYLERMEKRVPWDSFNMIPQHTTDGVLNVVNKVVASSMGVPLNSINRAAIARIYNKEISLAAHDATKLFERAEDKGNFMGVVIPKIGKRGQVINKGKARPFYEANRNRDYAEMAERGFPIHNRFVTVVPPRPGRSVGAVRAEAAKKREIKAATPKRAPGRPKKTGYAVPGVPDSYLSGFSAARGPPGSYFVDVPPLTLKKAMIPTREGVYML